MEFNKQELADYLHTTYSMVDTNFPRLKASYLKKGLLITKRGIGKNAIYEVEKVEPQNIDPKELSTYKQEKWEFDLPGEIWVNCYYNNDFEVSNFARIRNKKTLKLNKGTFDKTQGYRTVSIAKKTYRIHRVVLASFNPIENLENYTVDHIDGNRDNNKLENLRWVTNEENTKLMLFNRKELNKELTRLLYKHSYNEVL